MIACFSYFLSSFLARDWQKPSAGIQATFLPSKERKGCFKLVFMLSCPGRIWLRQAQVDGGWSRVPCGSWSLSSWQNHEQKGRTVMLFPLQSKHWKWFHHCNLLGNNVRENLGAKCVVLKVMKWITRGLQVLHYEFFHTDMHKYIFNFKNGFLA